jgi:type IV secretory pathway VirB2 component (pilin)
MKCEANRFSIAKAAVLAIGMFAAVQPAGARADVLEINGAQHGWIAGGPSQPDRAGPEPLAAAASVTSDVPASPVAPTAGPQRWQGRVAELAAKYDISPALLEALVWQESRWRENAVSPVGAGGLPSSCRAPRASLASIPTIPTPISKAVRGTCASSSTGLAAISKRRWLPTMPAGAGDPRERHPGDYRNPQLRKCNPRATFRACAEVDMKKTAASLVAALAAFPGTAFAQAASDPQGSGPIVAALGWLQGTLLGNVATAVAVMAVAAVGFMMLTGRLNWRFGATVIIGCFILFGSSAIVAGIQQAAG